MKIHNRSTYNNAIEKLITLTEDRTAELEGSDLIKEWPVNKSIKPNLEKLVKAIRYGMVIMIEYKGEDDDHPSGHERVIYPMVLGKSSDGKYLIRGYHFTGWSMSERRVIDKVWRLFRGDRIKSMSFTGSFYRLTPEGYNMEDPAMERIVVKANINNIKRNQDKLKGKIDLEFDDESQPSKDTKPHIAELKIEPLIDENIDLLTDDGALLSIENNVSTIHIYKAVFDDDYVALVDMKDIPTVVVLHKEQESFKGRYKLYKEVEFNDLLNTNIKTSDIYRIK
jgi:hypothetical protein